MEEFFICCMPSRHTYSRTTRLLVGPEPRVGHLREGSATLSVAWPDESNRSLVTVPIYKGDGKNPWSVPSNDNLQDILNPNNSALLCVLDESCVANELALHNAENDSYKYFRSIRSEHAPSGLRESFAGTPRISRRLFHTTPSVQDAKPICVHATPGIDEKQEQSFAAILNPLVVRVKLAGDDLAESDGHINLQQTLSDELAACQESGGFMMVEPIIPAADKERIRVLRKGARMLSKVEKTGLSRVLSLIWGSDERMRPETWLPFYCLDSLNGGFVICAREEQQAELGCMEKKWYVNTTTASANSRWFASYWAKLWGGTCEDRNPDIDIIDKHCDAIKRENFRTPKDYTGLVLPAAAREELNHHPGKLFNTLAEAPGYNEELYSFLAHVFHDTTSSFHQPRLQWIGDDNGCNELQVDSMSLLEDVGRKTLMPRSAVRVQFPAPSSLPSSEARELYRAAIGERYLDLCESVDWAGRRFGELLVTALLTCGGSYDQDGEEAWNLPYRANWWGAWYRGLFTQYPPKPVHFLSSFVLGVSKLGVDMLGGHGGSTGNYRPTRNMRF